MSTSRSCGEVGLCYGEFGFAKPKVSVEVLPLVVVGAAICSSVCTRAASPDDPAGRATAVARQLTSQPPPLLSCEKTVCYGGQFL